MSLTPALSRAARALLDLDMIAMARKSGVPRTIIADYEKGRKIPQRQDVVALKLAFEDAGIVFLADDGYGAGLRLRHSPRQVGLRPEELTAENDD